MSDNKRASKKDNQEHRSNQLAQLEQAITALTEKLATLSQIQKNIDLLQSVSLGLYDELDKLAKRAGADQITDLVLEQVNDVIHESKALMPEDTYVQRLHEFVAAGDNPQHRDALVVMRQVRQGLERLQTDINARRTRWAESLADAKGVKVAVELCLQEEEEITKDDLKHNEVAVKERWMTQEEDFDTPIFSFQVLDRTDIPSYFNTDK